MSFRPSSSSGIVLAKSAVQVSHTGDVLEFVLATIVVPPLGLNSGLRITALFSYTNSVNAKTFRVRFSGASGTIYHSQAPTATASLRTQCEIWNRNALNSQIGGLAGGTGGWAASATANPTSAVDTSVATSLVISGQLAAAGETLNLEQYLIELIP